jgi:hypothetical protein
MKTLMEIVKDHKSLEELLLEIGGELSSEEIETIVAGWMSEIQSGMAAKVDTYKYKMDALDVAAKGLKETADKFTQAARSMSKVADSLKERMKDAMISLETKSLEGNLFAFKVSETKPSVVVNEDLLPAEYMREKITLEPDKDKIRQTLESGLEVPGAGLRVSYRITTSIKKGAKT